MNASEILNRITKAKRSQGETLKYVLKQDALTGEKLRYCGSWLHIREWIQNTESRLMNANFCKKHLLCRCCAVRRAGRICEAYEPKVEFIQSENPSLIPAMATFTIKNGFDLAERIGHFKATWKKMMEAKRKGASTSGRHLPVEWNKVAGSLRAIKVTQGKDGSWHVHAHAFVLLTSYIDHAKLCEEWQKWSGDSFIVGIKKCDNGIRAGLIETVKYSVKFSSMNPEQQWAVHQALQGSRLVDPQGCLRGVPDPDIDSDVIEGMDGPFRDFIATWFFAEQRYVLRSADERMTYTKGGPSPLPCYPTDVPGSANSLSPTKDAYDCIDDATQAGAELGECRDEARTDAALAGPASTDIEPASCSVEAPADTGPVPTIQDSGNNR